MVEAFCSFGERNPYDSRNDEPIRKKSEKNFFCEHFYCYLSLISSALTIPYKKKAGMPYFMATRLSAS